MKKFVLLLVLVSSSLLAQEKYATVVVPKQFMFQKEANQYGLNDLCKLFFEKEGFQVLQETDVMTDEMFNNRCEYLYVDCKAVWTYLLYTRYFNTSSNLPKTTKYK